jgi:hypothetical protein
MARGESFVRFWPVVASAALLLIVHDLACSRSPLPGSPSPVVAPADAGPDFGPGLVVDFAPARPRAWQGPERVEDFPNLSYSAHVVMDTQGNVAAVWRQYGGSDRAEGVGANRFDRATGMWGQSRYIDDGKHDTTVPTLALDGAGNLLAVWEQPHSFVPPLDVYGARFDIKLGGWQAAGLVAETNSEGMLDPLVGLGSEGDGVVIWLQSKSGHTLHGTRYVGGAWQPAAELVREGAGNPGYPRLAVDASGTATMLWAEIDGPTVGLYLRRMDGGSGVWGDVVMLSSLPCYLPNLAVASSGEGVVTWTQPGGPVAILHVAYYHREDDAWIEELLPDAGRGNPSYPSVAITRDSALLVWRQGEDGGDVLASRRRSDGLWLPPALLGRGTVPYFWPRVAMDGTGAAVATWHRGPQGSSQVVAARYDPAADKWGEAVVLDNGAGSAANPLVVTNPAGLAVVLWEQQDPSAFGHLWANRWE